MPASLCRRPSRSSPPAALPLLPPPSIPPYLRAYRPPPSRSPGSISIDSAHRLFTRSSRPRRKRFSSRFVDAHHVLIASTGAELLTIARGVVPGATQLAPDLALYGAPNLIAAATAAHAPASILAPAESVAAAHPIWIAVRGGIALPLEGNWSNVNNLLRDTEYVTLALRAGDPAELELSAQCPTPNAALRFEQSFRAIVSLAAATSARQPSTAGVLQSIRIRREDRAVHVSLSAPLDALARLLP